MGRASVVPVRAPGHLGSDFDHVVEVLAVGQAGAADPLFGLRNPAVRSQDFAVAKLDAPVAVTTTGAISSTGKPAMGAIMFCRRCC
jgi:hypothetical protein